MTHLSATAPGRKQGRRIAVPIIAIVAVAMLGAVLTLAASTVSTPNAAAQLADTTCYTINDGEGSMTSWTGGAQTLIGSTGLSAIEALAANQDRNELWTYDNNTQQVYTFVPGSATPTSQFSFTDGDIDGLTWVNHTNGDPSDDQLWGTYRNPNPSVNNGPNEADEIVRIDPETGAILSGPTTITDPGAGTNNEQDDNDGLIWDPQTGNVYGVIGGDTTANELIIIDPTNGSISQIVLSLNGGDILDIESLGAGTDGQLYGTTGEDDVDANQFISINKSTGVVTVIGQFDVIGAPNTNVDYEATACLTDEPLTVEASTCFAVDEGNGDGANHLVQVDIATDTTITFTDLGLIPGANNIESIAYRNGFTPQSIYTQDPFTDDLIRINETDGTDITVVVDGNDIGDIDGLTWRYDNDADPSNDELWGVVRNGGDILDRIVQINPDTGAIISNNAIATTGTGTFNDVDGLAWDPSSDTFYAPIGGNGNINDLITVGTDGSVNVVGSIGIDDIEGLGFTDAGELFGMTGDDGSNPNTMVFLDKATGEGTLLGPITIYGDYESLDCKGVAPQALASLGDYVFEDTDQDGVQDAGEPGVPGVTVNLLDGNGDPTGQTTTTDANGLYSFDDLTPGDYIVEVVEPAGTDFTTQDAGGDDAADSDVDPDTGRTGVITLDPGENDPTNDAGIVPLASLGDLVFEDTDQDGVQDAGEPGIPGVTVNLLDGNGDPTGQTTTTDTNGLYSFEDLTPGDYIVEVVEPAGTDFTTQDAGGDDSADSDVDPDTGRTGVISLSPGENDPTNDAGIVPLASLGDYVFFDTDGDGVQDAGEPGVDGVTVNLLDGNGDPTGQTTTTDANGLYSFDGLTPGDYIVEVVEPAGTDFTTQDAGGDDAADSDVDPVSGRTGVISLSPGENDPTNDAGLVAELASLGDYVFEDTDQDGVQDAGEPGVPGVTVNLLDGNGDPTGQTTTTDANGLYSFDDLMPGDYIVEVVEPAGTDFTTQDAGGDDAADSDVDPDTGRTGVITLDPGENDPTNDAGIVPLASLGDLVFEDTDEDGVQDAGEPGIPGVTVNLLDGNGDPTGQTTTTDANGLYSFDDLTPGDYIVEVVAPADREFTTQDAGGDDAADSDVDPDTGRTGVITLDPGENDPTNDAGIVPPPVPLGSISDLVFEDTDQDGVQDAGEPGVEGVTVTLLDGNGDPIPGIDPVTTDANGNYIFGNLPEGDYIVEFTAPDGTEITVQDAGGDDAADSDADPDTGRTDVIPLGAGEDIVTVDAGIVPLASLGDYVFFDTDRDGVQDAGEPGVEGVTVNLLDGNGDPTGQTTTTDANGLYSFDDLTPGDYIVEVIEPAGQDFTTQDAGGDDAADSDVDPVSGRTGVITLDPGENDPTNDAGLVTELASLGDYVFFDTNADGVQDAGEPGVEGVTVNLLDGNGDPTGQTTTTDANGLYSFDDLTPGDYIVEVVEPAGQVFTVQDAGGDDAADSDVDPDTGRTGVINLSAGEDDITNDAGLTAPPMARIGNFVWRDDNRDGVQDPGEPGIEDVTVTVWSVDDQGNLDSIVATVMTDQFGEWGVNVDPGDYRVAVALPPGADGFSPQDAGGDDAADSDVVVTGPETGFTDIYTIANGDDNQTIDAGVVYPVLPARIGNFVWEDVNNNGLQDDGATGIEGVLVEVRDTGTNALVATDTTDANGEWGVTVDPGTYTVTFINTTTGEFTTQDAGGDDTIDSDADPTTGEAAPVTVGEDEENLTIDAGIVFPSPAIGLAKDLSDGPTRQGQTDVYDVSYTFIIENLGDVDLTDVTLTDNVGVGLIGTTGSVVSGPTPNAAGDCSTAVALGTQALAVGESCTAVWDFEIANPGGAELAWDNSASVEGTPPAGPPVTDTSDDGAETDTDGDGNGDEPGENDPTPALIPALASLGDKVWEDTNGNGLDDDGDNGVAGVTVNLLDENGDPTGQSTVTDADGLYSFDDLDAGTYIVEFVEPADRDFTTQDVPGDDTIDSDADPATGRTGPIVLAPGDDDPTNDAGVTPIPVPVGSISDFVWEDLDGDGIQDPGEPGIEGVTVTLLDGNGDPIPGIDPVLTDSDGNYIFANLPAGDYIVEFTAPDGREFTPQDAGDGTDDSDAGPNGQTGVISLAEGEDNIDVDAGIAPLLASLGDKVWEDTNGNGLDDDGANGIEGVTVNLLDDAGDPTGQTTTTDADGNYAFTDLPAGTYIVEFIAPVDREFTIQDVPGDDTIDSDADPATGRTGPIVLAPGDDDPTNDAGIAPLLASLGDKVWEDTNGNGLDDDGANGIEGVTVNLLDDAGDPTGQTTTTDADGNYAFTDLPAGTYIVEFIAPVDREFTIQDVPGDDTIDSDADPATGRTGPIVLAPGDDDPTNDAGIAPLLASLGDKVWEDTNGNGLDDDGDNGVAGVTVNLLDENGDPTGQSTVTDADGLYSFDDLDAGTYIVEFVEPADRDFTTQDVPGDDTIDSDADPATGRTGPIVLAPGDDDPTNDAGVTPIPVPVGSISDFVWEDLDGDGIQDPGEPGIEGVTVTLLDGNGDPIPGIDPVLTDSDGNYIFANLPAGDYIVEFTAPDGREFTPQDAGDGTDDSDAGPNGQTGVISLAEGEDNIDVDAGIAPLLGSISDFVWEDLDGDGIQDPGEPGIEGVTVTLLDGNGDPIPGIDPVLTDSDGNYIFDELPAGDYIVEFTAPDGREFTPQDAGDGTDDSDAGPNGQTGVISLAEGEDNIDVDAGIAPLVPAIGLAKDLSDGPTRQLTSENYDVSYTFIIENLGETELTDVLLTDNVAVGLAGTAGSVVSGPTPNAAGDCSTAVANGTQTLAVGESCTAVWDFVIANPGGAELAWDNSASVEGTPPVGPPVTDTSDDGAETDTDGDGNGDEPGENDPTPALIPALASLGDKVWEDTDGDGIQDADEPGIGGVTVNLLDENGDPTGRFATTAADGSYSFQDLDPGTYIVEFIEPADRDFTTQDAGDDAEDSDADPTTGRTGPIVLAPGDNDPTNDAGLTPLPIPVGSISDLVFDDLDGDGIQDPGEPGIEGVTVTLLDGNGDPIPGIDPVQTDANGNYIFGELPEGDYIVEFTAPDGREFSPQDAGDGTDDSDAGPDGRTAVINLGPGEINEDVDAGIVPIPLGSISDLVFDDLDGDGIQDDDEPGIEGVTVTLLDGNGDPIPGIDPVQTDANGNYIFDGLPEGDYIVEFTAPDGREFTPQDAGDGTDDSDAGLNGQTAVINLGPGEDNIDVDAGIAPLVPAIGLAKALTDGPTLDADGGYTITYSFVIENLGEVPLTDVVIEDDFDATFDGAAVEGPTPVSGTCDAAAAFNGTASLDVGESCTAVWSVRVVGLVPGETYNNTALATGTAPNGEEVTDISDDGTITDGDDDGNADEPGENDPTPAIVPPAEKAVLGDKVFLDANADGVQDPGEEPVAGVIIQVTRPDGSDLVTTTTDEDGLWSVELDPGDYVVAVVLPDGQAFSPQDSGDDDTADSDVDPESGVTDTISLGAGDVNPTVDAGLVPLGSLGNRVFLDANDNGVRDPGEAAVAGATVQLFRANADGTKGALVGTQVTPADGTYNFTDLPADDYIVVVSPPSGFVVGQQNAGDDEFDNDFSPITGESGVISIGIGEAVENVDAGIVTAPVVVVPPVTFPSSPPLALPNITNAPPGSTPPVAPATPPAPPLALTGSNSNVLATLAIAMMGVGGTMLIGARRERDKE